MKQISTYSKMNAHLLTHTHISRIILYAAFLFIGVVLSTGSARADAITLTYEDVSATSYSASEQTFTDGVSFGYINVIRNSSNGTPLGWAKDQVIQVKASGTLYNKAAISTISNIRVYVVANTNTFTLTYGTTTDCSGGSITRPTTATGSESITYSSYADKVVTPGQSTTATYYDFDLSSSSPTYFKITNGSNTIYIWKLVITYTPPCSSWKFRYGTDGQSDWAEECFSQVGETNEWQTDVFAIPNKPNWYVDNAAGNDGKKTLADWDNLYFAMSQGDGARPMVGTATGATGKVRIYDNWDWDNRAAGFLPTGYVLKFGSNDYAFDFVASNEYRTEIIDLNSTTYADAVSVGIEDGDGDYVSTGNTQAYRHVFFVPSAAWKTESAKFCIHYWDGGSLNARSDFMSAVPGKSGWYEGWLPTAATGFQFERQNPAGSAPTEGNRWTAGENQTLQSNKNCYTMTATGGESDWTGTITTSLYTSKGKFRMWDNSTSKNWYVTFYPHYVLHFDANGGSGEPEDQSIAIDASPCQLTVSATEPTRTGYTFLGWNESSSAASRDDEWDGGDTHAMTGDVTLYAVWSANTIEITLDKNNSDASGSTSGSTSIKYDATAVLSSPTHASRTGYTLEGYYAEVGCTNKVMTNAGVLVNYSGYVESGKWVRATSPTTLYAKWTPNNTSITLDTQSATTDGTTSVTATFDASTNLTSAITKPTKTGYMFEGYFTAKDGGGTKLIGDDGNWIASVDGYTDASKNWKYAESTLKLYAYWIAIEEFEPVTSSTTLVEGDEIIFFSGSNFMSTTQNDNNRGVTTNDYRASGDNYLIHISGTVQRARLEATGTAGKWLFKVGDDAYLYAASNSNNHLKTGNLTTVGDNGVWTISVDGSNNATITAQGTNSRKLMKYNSSKLFSCYDPEATVSGTSLPKLYYYHCSDPFIVLDPSTMETFTYAVGYGPSLSQSLLIKGYNLTGNLTVACPSGYELSSTSAASGFGTSNLTLTKDANDKVNTTIYIRLAAGASTGSYNQTLTISGGGITSTDVSLSGSVVATPSGTAYTLVTNEADIFPGDEIVIMNSSSDRLLSNKQATNNRIAATPNGGVNFEVLGSTVFTKTADPDSIQNIVVEGCDDEWLFKVGDNSYLYSAGSNSNYYLRSNTLASVGTNGRWKIQVDANLADTIRSIGTATNNTMWYNGNNTSIFSCYSTIQTEIPRIYAKPSATANVCGSPSALSDFETTYGTASTAQTISVKARNISTGNVTVTAPSGYEVCLTENGTYTSSVTITPTTGAVSATTVYVRLSASSNMGTYNSNLTISATDATTRYVALTGTVSCADPGLAFTNTEFTLTLKGSSVTSASSVFNSLSSGAYTATITHEDGDDEDALTFNTSTGKFTATAEGIWTVALSQAANGNYCAGDEVNCVVYVVCGTPAAPTGLEVSDIDYNEATISWNAVEGADHYDVIVSGKTSGGDESYTESFENITSTSTTVTGLIGGCTYEYYVTVTNTCGETADSDFEEFTTFYSVTYHSATEEDYVIGVASGGSVDAHGTDDCDNGKIFVGWTTSAVDALQQSDPTTNETGAIASVTANTDLYAVFAAQNGYTTTTMLDEKWNVVDWDGTNKIVGGAYSSWATNFDAAPNTSFSISSTTYKAIVFDVSSARTITSESAYSNLKAIQITGSNRSSFAMNVTVKVSTDKSAWTTVDTKSLGTASNTSPQTLVFALETMGNYYVRIETQAKSSGNKTGITNIRLFQEQDYYLTDYSTNCTLADSPAAITWENGSGTLADGTQPLSATIGTDITMPTLTKANYRFDGWKATLNEAKTDVFTGGDKYTVNHPVTFTAQWTQVFSVSDPTLGLTSCKDVKVTSTTQTFTTLGMHNAVPSVTLADGTYFTMTINSHAANSDDEDYSYTFTYQPNAYGTGSGAATNTTTATITDARTGVVSSPITLRGRSLPDEFVIAAKDGDTWYALPNTLAGADAAQGQITPIAIPVDNTTTPTKSTNPNAATIYGATGRYTDTNVSGIRFTNDGSHWLQISKTSSNYTMWLSNTGGTNTQDWYLKSTDFGAYEVFMDPIGSPDETRRIELYTSSGIKMGHHGTTRGTPNIYLLPIEYTVTYDDNGATSGEVPTDDTKYKYNATVTVLAKPGSLEKTGHTFLSWNTQADGNGTDYAADATFNITTGVTLFAKWTVNDYTFTLDDDFIADKGESGWEYGTVGSGSKSVTYDANTNLTSALTVPAREGYIFGGYYTEKDGSGTQLVDKDGNVIASVDGYTDEDKNWKYDGDLTVYAKWTDDKVYYFHRPIIGSGDRLWSNTANWTKHKVPTSIEDTIYVLDWVDIKNTTVAVADVRICGKYSGYTTYTPVNGDSAYTPNGYVDIYYNAALLVTDSIRGYNTGTGKREPTSTGQIWIYASDVFDEDHIAGKSGVLITKKEHIGNEAMVQYSTAACKKHYSYQDKETEEWVEKDDYVNQYFGIPFVETYVSSYYGVYMYKYLAESNSFQAYTYQTMEAFTAYMLLSANPGYGTNFEMRGILPLPGISSEATDTTLLLARRAADVEESKPTTNMFANSWMGPLDITAFDASDFVNCEASFYLFNAGSKTDSLINAQAGNSDEAGQWTTLSVSAVKADPALQQVLPPMQSFLLITDADKDAEQTYTLTLDYKKHVYDPAMARINRGENIPIIPVRAPKQTNEEVTNAPEIMRLFVEGETGTGDHVYIYMRDDFTQGFDNTWDGRKITGSSYAPQLYAQTNAGKMALNAVDDVEGTVIGFRKSAQESSFTITFEYEGSDVWYLNDLKEEKSTQIDSENSYTFLSSANDNANRFVISAVPLNSPTITTGTGGVSDGARVRKLMIDGILYIIREGRVYDVTGTLVK